MNQIIDFIVNDAAFKLQKGMTKNPTDKYDLFIDTSLFKLKMLSFIFWIDNNGIEAYAYDYKPDDDTLNYFINLSNEERSAIEQRILNKIKGIEVSSAPDLSTMDVERVSELVEGLSQAMQNDQDLAWTWHCNVAVTSLDEGVDHKTANLAAARFISTVFGVDVTTFEEWGQFERSWFESSKTITI